MPQRKNCMGTYEAPCFHCITNSKHFRAIKQQYKNIDIYIKHKTTFKAKTVSKNNILYCYLIGDHFDKL